MSRGCPEGSAGNYTCTCSKHPRGIPDFDVERGSGTSEAYEFRPATEMIVDVERLRRVGVTEREIDMLLKQYNQCQAGGQA